MSIMPAALIDMCRMTSCDVSSAKALLSDVDVNARFITKTPDTQIAYQTTLLAEAAQAGNINMVKLLLQDGADPNLIPEDEPILYDFLCPAADTVHRTNPCHLVAGLQSLRDALGFLHLLHDQLQPVVCLLVQICQVGL